MSPLRKILSLSVGLVVLGTLLIVINAGTGSAQSVRLNSMAAAPTVPAIPVNVVNAPTVNANINGTPTINANINGTPNVNATIANPASNPVLVSNLIDSANQAYTTPLCETDNPPNGFCRNFTSPVILPTLANNGLPVQQVVIEFVDGYCLASAGDDIAFVSINSPGPNGIPHYVLPTKTLVDNGYSYWTFSQLTKFYMDPGAEVTVGVRSVQQPGSEQQCYARVSGYLATH
jgi:hypothetical protein